LQITFIERPGVTALKSAGLPAKDDGTMKWMTMSDGERSITAILHDSLHHLVTNGQLKNNSIICVEGYFVDVNLEETLKGRRILVHVMDLTVIQTDVADCIGEPVNLFDAGVDPLLWSVPQLFVTPGSLQLLELGISPGICSSIPAINLLVTSASKVNECWRLVVSDGKISLDAYISLEVIERLQESGREGILGKDAVSAVLANGEDALKENDLINVSQCMGAKIGGKNSVVILNFSRIDLNISN
jgi:Replication factor-A protein 1, N-terminal domain